MVGALANAGIESLTIVPGAEIEEIPTFLTVVHQARLLTPEDKDDLGTLLWKQDCEHIHYSLESSDSESDAGVDGSDASAVSEEATEPGLSDTEKHELAPAEVVREQVREDAEVPYPRPGIEKLEKFDSTLYFLDESEIEYLRGAIEQDYSDDIGVNVVDLLFDTVQRETDDGVRDEVVTVLEELFSYLLGTGNYAGAAHVLSECRTLIENSNEGPPCSRRSSRSPRPSTRQRTLVRTMRRAPQMKCYASCGRRPSSATIR